MAAMNGKTRNILMLLLSTGLAAIGQLFFKASLAPFLPAVFAVGFVSYIASTVVYFYVLSRAHLSWTYGLGGLSYIFTVLLAFFVLRESIPPLRWLGVLVITFGVLLVGAS